MFPELLVGLLVDKLNELVHLLPRLRLPSGAIVLG